MGVLRAGASEGEAAREELAAGYVALIAPGATVAPYPVDRTLLIAAARLRASDLALKLPDAIHVSSAVADGCATIVSHDRKVRSVARSLGLLAVSLDLADLDALFAEIDAAS
ncbi:putative nucleic acid-binding protein [Methylopila jiangsuensis]|nr:putative nucleic acid-binding protein [Methylopila jiangsuensis]